MAPIPGSNALSNPLGASSPAQLPSPHEAERRAAKRLDFGQSTRLLAALTFKSYSDTHPTGQSVTVKLSNWRFAGIEYDGLPRYAVDLLVQNTMRDTELQFLPKIRCMNEDADGATASDGSLQQLMPPRTQASGTLTMQLPEGHTAANSERPVIWLEPDPMYSYPTWVKWSRATKDSLGCLHSDHARHDRHPHLNRDSMRSLWVLAGLAGVLLAACASDPQQVTSQTSSVIVATASIASATPAQESFSLNGDITITGFDYMDFDGGDSNDCHGRHDYASMKLGAPVVVTDKSGAVLAKSTVSLARGVAMPHDDFGCRISFTVQVPDGQDFYGVSVGDRDPLILTAKEARLRQHVFLP